MDILSHGLWGGAAFYKRHGFKYWLGFLFGVLPDLISFVPQFLMIAFGPDHFQFGRPTIESIRPLTFILYNITHSFVIFALIFGLIAWLRKKPLWELSAWGLHILTDIPTHTSAFFPTPFLWPLSGFTVSGFPWSQKWFILLNYSILALVYVFLTLRKRRKPPQI